MPSTDPRYDSPAWRKLRLVILARDGYECQMRGDKCTGAGDCVDHIVPVSQGGDFFSPSNLRAACTPCNAAGGAALTNARSYPPPLDW